mmetsp:Transcript_116076/g.352980  ORF Transcript_116076/g.352980 Transcript_116076/m.352980 type:complete len:233 (-) Transcript_116076:133-831(-)
MTGDALTASPCTIGPLCLSATTSPMVTCGTTRPTLKHAVAAKVAEGERPHLHHNLHGAYSSVALPLDAGHPPESLLVVLRARVQIEHEVLFGECLCNRAATCFEAEAHCWSYSAPQQEGEGLIEGDRGPVIVPGGCGPELLALTLQRPALVAILHHNSEALGLQPLRELRLADVHHQHPHGGRLLQLLRQPQRASRTRGVLEQLLQPLVARAEIGSALQAPVLLQGHEGRAC